jgi:hypothetical protein
MGRRSRPSTRCVRDGDTGSHSHGWTTQTWVSGLYGCGGTAPRNGVLPPGQIQTGAGSSMTSRPADRPSPFWRRRVVLIVCAAAVIVGLPVLIVILRSSDHKTPTRSPRAVGTSNGSLASGVSTPTSSAPSLLPSSDTTRLRCLRRKLSLPADPLQSLRRPRLIRRQY